jgi:hypothetical protein
VGEGDSPPSIGHVSGIPEPPDRGGSEALEAAVLQWVTERDAVLRGLTHALSNRAGTLGAVAGMLAPGEPVSTPVAAAVQDETGRLDGVLALYRLLPLDRGAGAEPLHLPDLVPAVVELHGHHAGLRDVPCAVEPDPDAPPVVAPHSALAHALLVLLAAGARAGGGEGARLRWARDGEDQVVITVDGAAEGAGAAAWLLGDSATVAVADGSGAATVALPTLTAARRRG